MHAAKHIYERATDSLLGRWFKAQTSPLQFSIKRKVPCLHLRSAGW
ncbi:hypothetical protein PsAD13_05195 [Pseudovibrio sp. Ad13]|nr:hypothetical protein PsAD13_05195 [Pseudovibrio sp. Ad13]